LSAIHHVEVVINVRRAGFPTDYLKANGCANARTGTTGLCNPEWMAAIYTLGPNNHPQAGSNNRGIIWWRAYQLGTQSLGKITADDGTRGVQTAFNIPKILTHLML